MAKTPTDQCCGNCQNYMDGECHLSPPQPVNTGPIGNMRVQSLWPLTQPDDWCGQWQQAKG